MFIKKEEHKHETAKFPELSKAVKYFKETEGGRSIVCESVEKYAKSYAAESRAEGRKEGQTILVKAVERLKKGETISQLLASGIDQQTIDSAMLIRNLQ